MDRRYYGYSEIEHIESKIAKNLRWMNKNPSLTDGCERRNKQNCELTIKWQEMVREEVP